MVLGLLAFGVIVLVAAMLVASEYRGRIAWWFKPTMRVWRVIRLLAVLLIAYGALISGRTILQAIALLGFAFVGVYIAVEQPHESVND